MKQTKRKAFNFLRSYFDVLNELDKDKDKLGFLMALINKQFLDEDPEELSFVVNLCYQSQRHQIESSVKGWKRATKDTLGTNPPTNPPTPPKEVEEEEKEEVQYSIDFSSLLDFINTTTKRSFKTINKAVKKSYIARLKDGYTKDDIKQAIVNAVNTQYHKDNNNQYLTPEFFSRGATLDKYSQTAESKQPIDPVVLKAQQIARQYGDIK